MRREPVVVESPGNADVGGAGDTGEVDPAARFALLMQQREPPLDLALGLLAAAGRPQVDPDSIPGAFDEVGGSLRSSVEDADVLCAELFGDGGFVGNSAHYYDPRNSLIDQVLVRRLGIPITLAVVGIEVGRRRGVELVGVGMPGHFLLAEPASGSPASGPAGHLAVRRWFDPFDAGRGLDVGGCARVFRRLHGPEVSFSPTMLAPVGHRMIIERVINNLIGARTRVGDHLGVAEVLALRVAANPADPEPRRLLAGELAAAGRFDQAASVHDTLEEMEPGQAELHRRLATQLRARLN